MLEGRLQCPTIPVKLRHPLRRYLARKIGQDVEQGGSMARRMIQCEPQTPQDVLGTMLIHHTYTLLGEVPGRGAIIRPQRTQNLKGQPLMLANNEEATTRVHLTQKCAGTKMAIGDPEIIRCDRGEHRSQQ